MITLTVLFCMTLNPTMCQELRLVPEDYRAIASPMECLLGGAIGSMGLDITFMKEGAQWKVKGYKCEAGPPKSTDVSEWVEAEKARLHRVEPQIK